MVFGRFTFVHKYEVWVYKVMVDQNIAHTMWNKDE